MRRWLPSFAWDRPVSVLMVFLALLVVGGIAWVRIPVQLLPSGLELSFLWVWVPLEEGAPREVDEAIVRPIEAQLATVTGLTQVESNANPGYAGFFLQFDQSADMDVAYNDVVDRLERAMPDLPDDVERYGIYRYDPNDEPVVWAGVSFPDSVADPWHVMSRVVQPRLERIPGVANMDVWGVPQRSVYVWWDREKLVAHGIDLGEVQRRLMADNLQMSGGRIREGGQDRYVRSIARIDDLETLRRYPIGDGLVLTDIAEVQLASALSYDINRVAGEDGSAIAVRKESTANTVEVATAVVEALRELEGDPRVEGARFHVFFNQAELIGESLDTLTTSALVGGAFALAILFLFLREWRMTLLIAASIPFSLLITVGVLYLRGDSLNVLSLMGLMLAVGMVVDNAIVVIETIYARRAAGAGPRAAAVGGTGEVGLAITLSTLTTMVVFLPVILMSESAEFSFFMGELGFPVVFALAASLLVALLFAPLATRFVGRAQVKPDPRWLTRASEGYARLLRWILTHRADATAALLAVAMLTVALPMRNVQCTGEGESNINDFTIRFTVPREADITRRDAIVRLMEDFVENRGTSWGVRTYRAVLRDGSYEGRINVYLLPEAPMSREQVIAAAKAGLPRDVPGVEPTVGWNEEGMGTGDASLTLSVHGEDMDTLEAIGDEIARRLEPMEAVLAAHVDISHQGADEIRLVADRAQLDRYGVSAREVGQTVSFAMRGSALRPMVIDGREVEVVSRFELADRQDVETLRDFPVFSPTTGGIVPLRALTHLQTGRGPSSIRREDGRTSLAVTVDLERGVPLEEAFAQVDAGLAGLELPRGYSWTRGDRFRQQQEDDAAQRLALLLSVTFVFLLMGVLFESFVLPLSIISTVPMAMLGAIWGLWVTGTPLDVMGGVGLVILVGVIVNNGIVLVDLVTQLRAEGLDRTEALVQAGRRRLRPILMTALTTIFGLVPMAVGSSSFIGIPYAPLGRVVMGGMAAGTLLTLLFVPFLYAVLDDLRTGAGRWLAFVRAGRRRDADLQPAK